MEVEKGNVSGLNGKVIQEDMDQRNSVANDINKILRGVESMSNKLEDLSSRVQLMEAVLQKFQQNQPGFSFSPVEESQGIPCDQNVCLPDFPENFKDLKVFRKWKKSVDSCFKHRKIP